MKSTHTLAYIGCALVLSACGGGGGGGTGSTPVQTSSLSTIAAADASKAAENAFSTSSLVSQSSSWLSGILTGVSVTPASTGVVSPVLALVKGAYRRDDGNLLTGVSKSSACEGGGTFSVDATLSDQSKLSNGDALTITLNNCVVQGSTENGTLSIKVSAVSGDILSSTGTATLDVLFNNFSVAAGSGATNLSGDMKISVNDTGSNNSSLAISGASLLTSVQISGATVASRALSSYSVTSSAQGTTLTSAANFSLSGKSNGLGQFAYTVKNLQPLVSNGTDLPTSGALIVNGAASSVVMTVVPNGVRVDHSDNGNGIVTKSSTLSWGDLFANF